MKHYILHRAVITAFLGLGFFLCLNLFLPGCGDDDNGNPVQTQESSNPFVGSWKLVKLNGQVSSVNMVWTFTDTTVTVSAPPSIFSGTYSYNALADPKTIDIRLTGSTPNPNLAVYKIALPDTLVLKVMDGASTRATNFNVEQGYDLEELKKQ